MTRIRAPVVFHIARTAGAADSLAGPARRWRALNRSRARGLYACFMRAGERMRAHKTHAANLLIQNAFDAADIGHDRAGLQRTV